LTNHVLDGSFLSLSHITRLSEAASRPRAERSFISRPHFEGSGSSSSLTSADGAGSFVQIETPTPATRDVAPPPVAAPPRVSKTPSARALYDFEPGS